MSKRNSNKTVSSQASDIVVDGLAELTSKASKAAELAKLQQAAKKASKASDVRAEKVAAMQALESRNPAILADTVRPAKEGELIGGKPAKGWVVTIVCQHADCECTREVNTQDAFQVRFCEEHRNEGRKAAGKERRQAAKVAKLESLDEAELDRQIAEARANLAA